MIVILSEAGRESAAMGTLCDSRGWPWTAYDSLRLFQRSLRLMRPRVVLTRHRIAGNYSDEAIGALKTASPFTKTIVLAPASFSAPLEARQVALGADLVLRDPVRMEVLVEYLGKYFSAQKPSETADTEILLQPFVFANAQVHPIERQLVRGKKRHSLTPREVQLAEILIESTNQLVTYETLYLDLLGRRFRGDTTNLRVLLGKLCDTARQIGVDLRSWIEVIPKLGYRYHSTPREKSRSR